MAHSATVQILDKAIMSLGSICKFINTKEKNKKIPQHEKERLRYGTIRGSFYKEKKGASALKCLCINERSKRN
jgi:hypothetical protein